MRNNKNELEEGIITISPMRVGSRFAAKSSVCVWVSSSQYVARSWLMKASKVVSNRHQVELFSLFWCTHFWRCWMPITHYPKATPHKKYKGHYYYISSRSLTQMFSRNHIPLHKPSPPPISFLQIYSLALSMNGTQLSSKLWGGLSFPWCHSFTSLDWHWSRQQRSSQSYMHRPSNGSWHSLTKSQVH